MLIDARNLTYSCFLHASALATFVFVSLQAVCAQVIGDYLAYVFAPKISGPC
jgi:hypothetical protein